MKQIVSNYTFNASARTITLTDYVTVRPERLQLITDVTLNVVLYNFADPTVATATASGNVITLSTITGASSSDHLQVIYDALLTDPTYDALGGVAQDTSVLQLLQVLGGASTYETDTLTVTGATGGTLSPQFGWKGIRYTVPALSPTALAAAVASMFQSAVGQHGELLPAGSVAASGGPLNTAPVVITFQGQMSGAVIAQSAGASALTGGSATFTRTTPGKGGLSDALAATAGGPNPKMALALALEGSDGNMYAAGGHGTSDSTAALQVYLTPQAVSGTALPPYGLLIGGGNGTNFYALNVDTSGNLSVQGSATVGSATPTEAVVIAGTDGTDARAVSVSAAGGVLSQASGQPNVAAPGVTEGIAGVDPTGKLQPLATSSGGVLAISDASPVPNSPISINGVAFAGGTPATPITIGTTSTTVLPDSTGGGSINGPRTEVELVNVGNVDITVCPSATARIRAAYVLRPGGSLIKPYNGPLSAITDNTVDFVAPSGTAVAQLAAMEWA
jgi:hypothetical protein